MKQSDIIRSLNSVEADTNCYFDDKIIHQSFSKVLRTLLFTEPGKNSFAEIALVWNARDK